ncbi:Cyclin-dependent kinase inhibitor [Artemisia annua]|uniref:Cyclin-dependent kinase inhibitor n=1 Tax=Artemisia annua TaxID=35608 RepID=A0A2U1PFH2_ARTAN|nr:Cyclin-dependent kinase inhibitor [Artemisia annua]
MEVVGKKRKISNDEELRLSKRYQFDSDVSVSCCSSNGSVHENFRCRDLQVSENERDDLDARERESTPTSKLNDEIVEEKLKSAEKIKSRREIPQEKTPPAAEIEAFFAAAENDLHKRFKEKYNFDIVNGVPLKGRYEWVELKP